MCKDARLCHPKCCIKKLLKIKNLLCFCAAAKKRTDSFQNPSAFLLTVFILQVGKNPLLQNLQCCMRKSLDRNCRDLSPKAAPRRHPKGRPW